MNNWSDSVLTFAAQISDRLSFVSRIGDFMTDRLVSPSFANAGFCYASYFCGSWCGRSATCDCGTCAPHTLFETWGWNWQQCAYGSPTCEVALCNAC